MLFRALFSHFRPSLSSDIMMRAESTKSFAAVIPLFRLLCPYMASLVAQMVKSLPAVRETQVRALGQEDPLEKDMATHSVLLPGESHGGRSLVGYSPWGCKESDMIEQLHNDFLKFVKVSNFCLYSQCSVIKNYTESTHHLDYSLIVCVSHVYPSL